MKRPGHSAWGRLREWYDIAPPESFTYRSYIKYAVVALPRFGIGPGIIVGYHVFAGNVRIALLLLGWMTEWFLLSLLGFAIERRDAWIAMTVAIAGSSGFVATAWYLVAADIDQWLLLVGLWFGILATLVGLVAANR